MRVVALPKVFYCAVDQRPMEPIPHQRSACGTGAGGADPPPKERLRDRRRWSNLRAFGFTAAQAAALLEFPCIALQRLNQPHRAEGPIRLARRTTTGRKAQDRWRPQVRGVGSLGLHRRSNPKPSQTARGDVPTFASRHRAPRSLPSARLRRPQAKRLTASSGDPLKVDTLDVLPLRVWSSSMSPPAT